MKIRNKWIKAEIDLYEISVPPTTYDDVTKKFVFSSKWLPVYDCCKNLFYDFELEGVRRIRQYKRKPRKQKIYVNPIAQAMDYRRMMKEGNLTQIELARELGISRVRVTQYLNLLKLPKAQLDHIMQNRKKEKITESQLRGCKQFFLIGKIGLILFTFLFS